MVDEHRARGEGVERRGERAVDGGVYNTARKDSLVKLAGFQAFDHHE